jgi:hypothetical protein
LFSFTFSCSSLALIHAHTLSFSFYFRSCSLSPLLPLSPPPLSLFLEVILG